MVQEYQSKSERGLRNMATLLGGKDKETEVALTNEEVSVAFNNQEELIIDRDVLPGNDMEMKVIKNHEYSELPIVIAGTTNVVEVSDPEISRGARGIEFLDVRIACSEM